MTNITPIPRRGRLRRSDCSGAGLRRIRRGRGFTYLDEHGERIGDPEALERLQALGIPPAWKDVWICPDPLGHLQATGVDAAGRKQYLYHPRWRERRDREKFEKMIRFGAALPGLRRQLASDLKSTDEPTRTRVLACGLRMLDLGLLRIGSEEYADEEGGFGLATIRKDHATVRDGVIHLDFLAKAGVRRVQTIAEPQCSRLVCTLKRRRSGEQLLAYREGRRWREVRSEQINDHLKEMLGEDFSAKDFRTWNATVMAAVSLASIGRDAGTKTARKRAMDQSVRAVAELLGNTPAVARRAYIDPRVFDRYQSGWTVAGALEGINGELEPADDRVRARIEAAVLDLLTDNRDSEALERIEAPHGGPEQSGALKRAA